MIIQYAVACANLYGLIEYPKFLEIYNGQNEPSVSSSELRALLTDAHYANLLKNESVFAQKRALIHYEIEHVGNYSAFLQGTIGKPFYVPEKEELLRYSDEFYYEKTSHQKKLAKMLTKDFFGGSTLMIENEMDELIFRFGAVDADVNRIVQAFLGRFECKDMNQMNEYVLSISGNIEAIHRTNYLKWKHI